VDLTFSSTFFSFRIEKERMNKQYGRPQIGGPFSLTTDTGKPFTDENLLGKWSLVYFGFTNCPDICPAELDKVTSVLDSVGTCLFASVRVHVALTSETEKEHGKIFQPLFITVDPVRDSQSRVSRYLQDFHPSFTGLFGSYDATKAVCKAYRVYFSTPPNADPNGDYLVDHSIFVYLMDPHGKFVEAFGQSVGDEEVKTKINEEISQWQQETGKKA
jgi:protein SCO1/2